MSLKEGQKVKVLAVQDDGWGKVSIIESGKEGLVPLNHLAALGGGGDGSQDCSNAMAGMSLNEKGGA